MQPPPLLLITASHSELCSCLLSLQRLGLERTETYYHRQRLRNVNAFKVMSFNRKVKSSQWTCAPWDHQQVPGRSWGVNLSPAGSAMAAPHTCTCSPFPWGLSLTRDQPTHHRFLLLYPWQRFCILKHFWEVVPLSCKWSSSIWWGRRWESPCGTFLLLVTSKSATVLRKYVLKKKWIYIKDS